MAYWGKGKSSRKGGGSIANLHRPTPVHQDKASGGFPTVGKVRSIIKDATPNTRTDEFYELEMAEVIDVILTEDKLPDLEDGSDKDWSVLGTIVARGVISEKDADLDNIIHARPLDPGENCYPLRGEYVIIVEYNGKKFFCNKINLYGTPNSNMNPGLSGARPDELIEEDFIFEDFEIDDEIRRMWPYQGDSIFQGRWGNSIRFGSNITAEAHEDEDDRPDSPNILIRAGQLLDADNFNKSEYVEELKNSINKPV